MKRRAPGAACVGGRRCIAILTYRGSRLCALHGADWIMADHVKARDGRCRRCGALGPLEWAHILRRGLKAVRWAEDNSMALCVDDHAHFTAHPLEWQDWCRNQGVDLSDLRHRAWNGQPMDPLDVIVRLGWGYTLDKALT